MQYRLIQLMWATALCSIVLALFRLHPLAVAATFPVVVGPWMGRRVSRSPAGAVLGLLAALFGSLVVLLAVLLGGHFGSLMMGVRLPVDELSLSLLVATYSLFLLIGGLGGYVGGRMSVL